MITLFEESRVYIMGPISQADKIESIANDTLRGYVRYIKPEKNISYAECARQSFNNIEWADIIYVITNDDCSIGEGISYEIEYARRLRKTIVYHTPNDKQ